MVIGGDLNIISSSDCMCSTTVIHLLPFWFWYVTACLHSYRVGTSPEPLSLDVRQALNSRADAAPKRDYSVIACWSTPGKYLQQYREFYGVYRFYDAGMRT